MEYKVKKFFIDRDSLKKFSQGDIFPCEDSERAAFLTEKGYLEAQEIPTEPRKSRQGQKRKKRDEL